MFTVFYRTGGTARFQWHQVLETYTTMAAAVVSRDGIFRQGYHAFIAPSNTPMPVRYDAGMEP